MQTFSIREFAIEDYEKVYALWQQVFPDTTDESYARETIRVFLQRNSGLSFVAEIAGEIVGCVLTGYDGRRAYLYHLAVAEKYRRLGIGRRLLEKTERAVGEMGVAKIHLTVFKKNLSAKNFYTGLGYRRRRELDFFSKELR